MWLRWLKSFFALTAEDARQSATLPPVERLEPRLCLGSMHAAGIADLLPDPLQGTDHSSLGGWENASLLDELTNASVASDEAVETVPAPEAGDDLSLRDLSRTQTQHFVRQGVELDGRGLVDSSLDAAADDVNKSPTSDDASTGGRVAIVAAETLRDELAEAADAEPAANLSNEQNGASTQAVNARSDMVSTSGEAWDAAAQRAIAFSGVGANDELAESPWWETSQHPITIGYDFRDLPNAENVISDEQKSLVETALQHWSEATDGKIQFQLDTQADSSQIINIGVGDVQVFGHVSGEGGLLGLGGGQAQWDGGQFHVAGLAWLDGAEAWDNTIGNGNPHGTVDFTTVVAHEIGHTLGFVDAAEPNDADMMDGGYRGERSLQAIDVTVARANPHAHYVQAITVDATPPLYTPGELDEGQFVSEADVEYRVSTPYAMQAMTVAAAQLDDTEVEQLLSRASRATASEDAIIAVVDRNGRILGVRAEADVLSTITDSDTLVFAIDGAVAKARTAAMFSNGNPDVGTLAPLTSRTVRFLSQSTVTQREVESNPNVDGASAASALASITRGPGFVAPVGVGGHFPPDIDFTPPVDLFAIEHTNRDSTLHPGPDGVKGTADDITLRGRFNIDPAHVPAGNELTAPESYGHVQNSGLLPDAQSRGIATLPGGIPLFRDTNGDGVGETLVGGIGVFFPGADGTATFEQDFVAGVGQTTFERTNAAKVLEAEYIAFAAAGGSRLAQNQFAVEDAKIGDIAGAAAVTGLDVPFGRLDLVGIQLEVVGPIAGKEGLMQVLDVGAGLGTGVDSGADQPLIGGTLGLYRDGELTPGDDTAGGVFLVTPHSSADMTAAEVNQIIAQGLAAADEVRAAVRLPLGSRTKMVFAVTDTTGEVLGLYRMQDATTFSIDVAVAKARNVAYYADASVLEPIDTVPGVAPGVAFSNRTFRFLAEPRFPSGIDGIVPDFSILNDGSINVRTAENIGAPDMVSEFDSVLGNDAFFPMTNFRDPGDASVVAAAGADTRLANQNGIVFFPGSTPLYRDGVLIGGLGVSGDGVDQDDVVTSVAAAGFQPFGNATRADEVFRLGVRLPFQKFLRNPWG